MALEIAFSKEDTGEQYPAAYARVDEVNINRRARGVEIVVGVYRDTAAGASLNPVARRTVAAVGVEYGTFESALATKTPLQIAYAVLKLRAEYASAKDV